MLKSPIARASDKAWSDYVTRSVKQGPVPSGLHGAFRLKLRSLEDIGIVQEVTKNSSGKHSAKWVKCTPKQFSSSIALQYDAFKKVTLLHVSRIDSRYQSSIGVELEGVKASLSGLLTLMRVLGMGCFEKYLNGDRLKETTAIFLETNGIF